MKSLKQMTDEEVSALFDQVMMRKTAMQETAKDTGVGDAIAIGAGRVFDKGAAGLEQLFQGARSLFGSEEAGKRLGEMNREQAYNDRAYESLQEQRPIATTVGETLPFLLAPAARTTGGAMATGAVPQLASYGSVEDRLLRGGIGAAGGAVGKYVGDKIVGSLVPKLENKAANLAATSAQKSADLEEMAKLGIRPTAGQMSGIKPLEYLESQAGLMFGGGSIPARNTANREALTAAANKLQGESGNVLTEDVSKAAAQRLGPAWENAAMEGPLALGPAYRAQVQGALSNTGRASDYLQNDTARALLQNALKDAETVRPTSSKLMPAARYVENRKALNDIIGAEGEGKNAARTIKTALDDARAASFSDPEKMKAWLDANRQWANMEALKPLATGSKDGTISAAQLFQRTRNNGADDLRDLARLTAPYLKDPPNSGTAPRGVANALLGAGAATLSPLLLAAPFLTSKTVTSPLMTKAAAVGLPKAGQALALTEAEVAKLAATYGISPAQVGQLLASSYDYRRNKKVNP